MLLRVAARCSVAVRGFHASGVAPMPALVVQVPSMGDSISEGGIVEWTVAVGDYIHVDDTVVVLETDKVSIDVRADTAGTLLRTIGEVDDSVLVGADLYEIDTDGEAPAAAPKAAAPKAAAPKAAPAVEAVPVAAPVAAEAPPAAAPPAAAAAAGGRVPSIKFLGSRKLLAAAMAGGAGHAMDPNAPGMGGMGAAFAAVPSLFGRLPLSEREMAAVDAGIDEEMM